MSSFTQFSVENTLHDLLTVSVKLNYYTNQIYKDFNNVEYTKVVFFINTWSKVNEYLQNNDEKNESIIITQFSKLLNEFTLDVQTKTISDINYLLLLPLDSLNLHVLKMTYKLCLIININIINKLTVNFLNEKFKSLILFYFI